MKKQTLPKSFVYLVYLFGILLLPGHLLGQCNQPVLFKDLNPNGFSSPTEIISMHVKLFFVADGGDGRELWVSDGTPQGTQQVLDIYPGIKVLDLGRTQQIVPQSSLPKHLTIFQRNKLVFQATDASGTHLWISDGTSAGTKKLANCKNPSNFYSGLRSFYFQAENEYGKELWISDGTPSGTKMLKDLYPGSKNIMNRTIQNNSEPADFFSFDRYVYFTARNASGRELWRTDGTAAGTTLYKDIWPGTQNFNTPYSSNPHNFASLGGLNGVLFAADGPTGIELWSFSRRTYEIKQIKEIGLGTRNMRDFGIRQVSSKPKDLQLYNGKVYFSAATRNEERELWVSDGTEAGTYLFKDLYPGTTNKMGFPIINSSDPSELSLYKNLLFFRASNEQGAEIWLSDGTPEGTRQFADLKAIGNSNPSNFTVFKGKLFFSANGELYTLSCNEN